MCCLARYKTEEYLQKHLDYCFVPQAIEMPKANTPGAKCEFREFKKTQKFPFIIYADFETIARPVEDSVPINTVTYQSHEAVSYGYVVVDWTKKIIHQEFYNGSDCVRKFYTSLRTLDQKLRDLLAESVKPLSMTAADEEEFQASTRCVIT